MKFDGSIEIRETRVENRQEEGREKSVAGSQSPLRQGAAAAGGQPHAQGDDFMNAVPAPRKSQSRPSGTPSSPKMTPEEKKKAVKEALRWCNLKYGTALRQLAR
jgi:hypothetical protein